jgi:inorganic pyrophosphatase
VSSKLAVEVVIEVPKWGFVKRGMHEHVDFVSPVPCPFNYGSIVGFVGLDGDLLDALVLGPRLRRGARVVVTAFGAVGLSDRDMYDDKVICSAGPIARSDRERVLRFLRLYGRCKRVLNFFRGRPGLTRCEGWGPAEDAFARATALDGSWKGPVVPF